MEYLEKLFKNIERIADALEKISNNNLVSNENSKLENQKEETLTQTTIPVMQTPINTQPAMQIPAPIATQVPTSIPTSQQVEAFTQEQIARAMANAMQVGKHDLVQSILRTFNAQCLMEIDKSNYNKIATMLREAGIEI